MKAAKYFAAFYPSLFAVIFLRPSGVRVATATVIPRRIIATAISRIRGSVAIYVLAIAHARIRIAVPRRSRRRRAVIVTAGIAVTAITAVTTRIVIRYDKIAATIPTNALRITEKNIPKTVLITTTVTTARAAIVPITSVTHSTSILLVYLRKISYYIVCKTPHICVCGAFVFYVYVSRETNYSHSIVPQGFGVKS